MTTTPPTLPDVCKVELPPQERMIDRLLHSGGESSAEYSKTAVDNRARMDTPKGGEISHVSVESVVTVERDQRNMTGSLPSSLQPVLLSCPNYNFCIFFFSSLVLCLFLLNLSVFCHFIWEHRREGRGGLPQHLPLGAGSQSGGVERSLSF